MIQPIAELLGNILLIIYRYTGQNYGVAIILLTILVRLVTWPLTNKQLQSARSMQALQPEIKKIQEKYKNDKEKLNQETMALWKKHKVNPAAGCLPLLIQFPVLIAMFSLLKVPLQGIDNVVFLGVDMTLALAPEGMASLAAYQTNVGYYILVALSGITTYLQQKIMMTDKSQQALMTMMPIMLLVFSVQFPAGLVMYWVVNNILSAGHHILLSKMPAKGALNEK